MPEVRDPLAMTDFEPEAETESPAELRNAAIEALQNAARQRDPNDFGRLTRHALHLIERARAIPHGRRRAVPEVEGMSALRSKDEQARRKESRVPRKLGAKFIGVLCRFSSWRAR
jgi:hypothetical protein